MLEIITTTFNKKEEIIKGTLNIKNEVFKNNGYKKMNIEAHLCNNTREVNSIDWEIKKDEHHSMAGTITFGTQNGYGSNFNIDNELYNNINSCLADAYYEVCKTLNDLENISQKYLLLFVENFEDGSDIYRKPFETYERAYETMKHMYKSYFKRLNEITEANEEKSYLEKNRAFIYYSPDHSAVFKIIKL